MDKSKYPLLSGIHQPGELKLLSEHQLVSLSAEIRQCILDTVGANGGHLASNLGVVELSIALLRVFHVPEDKIVWDVGHQCYAYKLLTGRLERFDSLRKAGGISGFPKRSESVFDAFGTGHASTSISAALGMLTGDRLQGNNNCFVAVIGDGALTGGLSYEALSNAGQLNFPLIVILNDNKMSIGTTVGGLSRYLSRISVIHRYQRLRSKLDMVMEKTPFLGPLIHRAGRRVKRAVKAAFFSNNFFVDFGFEYSGPIDGHDVLQMEQVFTDARDLALQKTGRPVVIHVVTKKGKGYPSAEARPDAYHSVGALKSRPDTAAPRLETFTQSFAGALLDAARKNDKVVAITAAMESGTGLTPFREAFPGRFFDVGIAEEHAVTFAAGLAAAGLHPVVAVYSTFIQRAIDQTLHDVCVQGLPVVFVLDHAGFVPGDGATHQGLYDLAFFRAMPGMTILCPASDTEMRAMLDYALSCKGPVMLRYPKACCPVLTDDEEAAFKVPLQPGRGVMLTGPAETEAPAESSALLAFTGSLFPQAKAAASLLRSQGINAVLYNLRFVKPLDGDYLKVLASHYTLTVVLEEAAREGGIGAYISSVLSPGRVLPLAVLADAPFQGSREELLAWHHLDGPGIAAAVEECLRTPII